MTVPSQAIVSTFNYVGAEETRPAYYLYKVDPAVVKPLPDKQKCRMQIQDCRPDMANYDLDVQGFAFGNFQPTPLDYYDGESVRQQYYPQVAQLVQAWTGASQVTVFDHNVRFDPKASQPQRGADRPVRFVHNDYTEISGPQRVKDILGDSAAATLLGQRFAFINVWRPISGPVLDMPLGILDARSLQPDNFVATDLIYADRTGEVSSVRHRPEHRWHYLSAMQTDEVLFLKCFGSDTGGRTRYGAHSAFADPTTPADAPPRESIEARTLVFFGAED